MNLLFRLLGVLLMYRFRTPVGILEVCRTPFHCWPNDLDLLRHMNNGRYLTIMDLGRTDLMYRAGLAKPIADHGYYPVVVSQMVRYRKSLQLWDRFEVQTRVLGWDDKAFLMSQKFYRGQTVIAEAVVRARFLKKAGGSVKTSEILALAGVDQPSPEIPAWVSGWNTKQMEA